MVAMITMLVKLAECFGRRRSRRGWVRRLGEWLPILLVLAALGCLRLRLMKMAVAAEERKLAPGCRRLSIGSGRGSLNSEEREVLRFYSECEASSSIRTTPCTLICLCAAPEISKPPRYSRFVHPFLRTALLMCEKCDRTIVPDQGLAGLVRKQRPWDGPLPIAASMSLRGISTSPDSIESPEQGSLLFPACAPAGSV